jgi:hypothetical protein
MRSELNNLLGSISVLAEVISALTEYTQGLWLILKATRNIFFPGTPFQDAISSGPALRTIFRDAHVREAGI